MEPVFDIDKLRQAARVRWLKPPEVLFILQNNEGFGMTYLPPDKPPSGSLFIFNKRIRRFFRKDGYDWQRKKDGRASAEGHEKLKVKNVESLNCYYARAEHNSCFQRRSYWMLDPAYEHNVLVHYLDVTEEGRLYGPNQPTGSCSTFNQTSHYFPNNRLTLGTCEVRDNCKNSCSPGSIGEVTVDTKMAREDATIALHAAASQFCPLVDNLNPQYCKQRSLPFFNGEMPNSGLSNCEDKPYKLDDVTHNLNYGAQCWCTDGSVKNINDFSGTHQNGYSGDNQIQDSESFSAWKDVLETSSNLPDIFMGGGTSEAFQLSSELEFASCYSLGSGNGYLDTIANHKSHVQNISSGKDKLLFSSSEAIENSTFQPLSAIGHEAEYKHNNFCPSRKGLQLNLPNARYVPLIANESIKSSQAGAHLPGLQEDLPHVSSSCASASISNRMKISNKDTDIDYSREAELVIQNKAYSSNYSGVWSDGSQNVRTLGAKSLNAAVKQKFRIHEVSPEWTYSSENTKVIITGDFLCAPDEKWKVMFGDTEVPFDIIQEGVIRCYAPQHFAGKVKLCISTGNREACSDARDFDYLQKQERIKCPSDLQLSDTAESKDELLQLANFVQMLLYGNDTISVLVEDNGESEIDLLEKSRGIDCQLENFIENRSRLTVVDHLLQGLLKDKLLLWLSTKCPKDNQTSCSLSKQEQSIIHLIASLGYEWALHPVLNSGVGINIRDDRGWTALHWAARFGREGMVAALLAAGASAGAVGDPTAKEPIGKTAASIAAAYGHKGLAGYLSEEAVGSHLSNLKIEESEFSKLYASVEAERVVENISDKAIEVDATATEDQLSVTYSLAAVKNAALAAARIQNAFRVYSFKKRQQRTDESYNEYSLDTHNQMFRLAALRIQKKFRGWKGRRNFLVWRQNAVKIQAHVRGHQVRKKYKDFLRTASFLEKAILRWRRKGVGLRGFHAGFEEVVESEEDDILKSFRRQRVYPALEEAVSRVVCMAESPKARHQYRRVFEHYHRAKSKLWDERETASSFASSSSAASSSFFQVEENPDGYMDSLMMDGWVDLEPPNLMDDIWAELDLSNF